MLHLIFQSPIETALLERIDSGDVVVFLENAALRVLQNSSISDTLTRQLGSNRLCVLSDDIAIRGIASDELVKGIEMIDYDGLVELTVNNPIIQTWT
ncbi:sulfurtransferase complex subunit TusB [Methylobacter sp.]|uniref:sulfurtransferase complex subunit TusB n=1 Tax=Methylobacter sp. TaxID=2051955 RepID=UPI002486F0CE|nr:sulfurtransferase complex subunit TusB [Methylobacter sp.]MDI1277071.1 sulfurtransferase complex subunit TusB [Methylobacter sp.]MDI1358797.1 sulfurtransferase complex subunit TusB [Methylobacter sp.]